MAIRINNQAISVAKMAENAGLKVKHDKYFDTVSLIVKDAELGERLHFAQFATGGTLGPQDSYMVLRGIKTLHLRVQRHCENGEKVAHFLRNHSKIDKNLDFP